MKMTFFINLLFVTDVINLGFVKPKNLLNSKIKHCFITVVVLLKVRIGCVLCLRNIVKLKLNWLWKVNRSLSYGVVLRLIYSFFKGCGCKKCLRIYRLVKLLFFLDFALVRLIYRIL